VTAAAETPQAGARRLSAPALRDGFVPEALHTYTDCEGAILYWRIRAKHPVTGAKWIRPMKRKGGGFVLGEPTADDCPAGKPLYRLHDVARRPEETVIVTEGELKADKLADLGLLATTSGSADSAGRADWRPLAGREVIIWPDNDEAGQRYAEAVIGLLKPLGSVISVIDVSTLGLPEKGDAADWVAGNPDATAVDVLALRREPNTGKDNFDGWTPPAADDTTSKVPNTCKYGNGKFMLTEGGVFFTGTDDQGNEKAPVWVCSPLWTIAKTRDTRSGEWGRLLEWFDDDGVRHQWSMPLELLEGDGVDVRRELARLGLHIATSKHGRDLLAAYLKVWPVEARARCVDRLGWHGQVYATPAESIGATDEIVVFQNAHAIEPALAAKGTVDSWRESVAALAVGNSRLVFAISVAFAAPLADVAGEDSGGFHLRGKSSSGKSTALKVAASVWGEPTTYARVWRATTNGLEGLAALHNDGLLILDELSQCDPKEAGEAAYLLANGQGKARAGRSGTARASQRWRVLFLSAGEESLSALMARGGRKVNTGQEIRLADFDADAGAGFGAFEVLHDQATGAAFSEAVKVAASRHYGAVGLAWLRFIVPDRSRMVSDLMGAVQHFVSDVVPPGASGQVARVARRFALVAAAGELATKCGLTGWVVGEATHAVRACFESWLDCFGGIGNREERDLLAQVRAFFEAHGASRFEDAEERDDQQRVINRAGFYRGGANGVREYLVLPEAFKNEVCKGRDSKAAEKLLIEHGWIEPGGDGRATQKPRLHGLGTTARVYVFSAKVLGADE